MVSPKILGSSKLYSNGSNNIDAVVVDDARLCVYNLSSDKLSISLLIEVVSPIILVRSKLYLNGLNNIDDVVVNGPRLGLGLGLKKIIWR